MKTPEILEAIAADIRAGVEEPEKEWELLFVVKQSWLTAVSLGHVMAWAVDSPHHVRRKPRTLTYEITVPEPMREAPPLGTYYYYPMPHKDSGYMERIWCGDPFDLQILRNNCVYAEAKHAAEAGKQMRPRRES